MTLTYTARTMSINRLVFCSRDDSQAPLPEEFNSNAMDSSAFKQLTQGSSFEEEPDAEMGDDTENKEVKGNNGSSSKRRKGRPPIKVKMKFV